jgi:transcriptional regulator with XRE-family HTH domain
MSYFAERLKNLRMQLGLSMQALADEAKVSKSMISKIERDEVQPTIDVAARLSNALGKTLSEMLHATQSTQAVYLSKDKQAVWEDSQHVKRRNISPVFEGLKIEWLQVELPAKAGIVKCMPVNKQGEEKFILVTKGTLEVKVNHNTYKLKKGDSLYFDATYAHDFANTGKDTVEYYIVIKHG